jgi:hypothetical protein
LGALSDVVAQWADVGGSWALRVSVILNNPTQCAAVSCWRDMLSF